jgi:hypothetical protein
MKMKRYNPVRRINCYGETWAEMEESADGHYVLAEDAFREAGYEWDYKTASWKEGVSDEQRKIKQLKEKDLSKVKETLRQKETTAFAHYLVRTND